jgi:hypothetical protein
LPVIRSLRLLPLVAACALSACAIGPDTSYVAPLPAPTDAAVIAAAVGSFMRTQLPAASSTIVLEPTPSDQASNALTPMLAGSLRRQGFAVAESSAPAGSHSIRYWVTPLDASGELVRLMIDGRKGASQFFVRNKAGNLQAGGPFTVSQMEASR